MNGHRHVLGTLTADEIHELQHVDTLFEIAAHTRDHLYERVRARLGVDEALTVKFDHDQEHATAALVEVAE